MKRFMNRSEYHRHPYYMRYMIRKRGHSVFFSLYFSITNWSMFVSQQGAQHAVKRHLSRDRFFKRFIFFGQNSQMGLSFYFWIVFKIKFKQLILNCLIIFVMLFSCRLYACLVESRYNWSRSDFVGSKNDLFSAITCCYEAIC